MVSPSDLENSTYIGQQIGDHLALRKSSSRGYIAAFHPYQRAADAVVKHKGTVGGLLATKLPYGTWVIEVDEQSTMLYFLVRWSESRCEWENLGRVKFGVL